MTFVNLHQDRIYKANPCRLELIKEEQQKLEKLNGILDKLRRGENVQNRQLQTFFKRG